ncbi:MAG: hypothetical protein HQK87_08350, partial [Nitrospinae bacterium]|nr:hypothetical protein [Nitrospinota bacterium]
VSVYAVSAVLVAFMAGLGIGAHRFGQMLGRGIAPVRLYALLEAGIGLYLLAFPQLYATVESLYVALAPVAEGVEGGTLALRFALAFALLIVPTTLMGGTLPAMVRAVTTGGAVGSSAGVMYAVNTLGAMAGALAAGFWLIEAVGLAGTTRIGALANLLLAATAWGVAAEPSWRMSTPVPPKGTVKGRGPHAAPDRALMLLFGVSGFCALALEVLWTRLLVLALNGTTYAFTLILALFLGGIGAGGATVAWWLRTQSPRADRLFGAFQLLLGLCAALTLVGFALYPVLFDPPAGGVGPLSPTYLYACLLLAPAVFLMGGSFPLAVEGMKASVGDAPRTVGRLYAVNTAGCVIGSLVAGFVLIPHVGAEGGTLAVAWTAAVVGGGFLVARGGSKPLAGGVAAVMVAVTVMLLSSEETLARSLTVWKLDRGSRVAFFAEGPSATVLVSHTPTDMSVGRQPVERLWINGDPIAGTFREALQLERLLAHIPLSLAPAARNGLIVCFGTGSTAGAALAHGLSKLTVVDISPEVFAAAPLFARGNRNVTENPRLKTVVEDGRSYLLTTRERYDFISVEPPPPSNAGVVSLYTVEFYRLSRERLTKNGLFSQWIPLHHLSPGDFARLVASFQTVYPHGQVWFTKWDAILVGGAGPIVIDHRMIAAAMRKEEVAASLAEIGYTTPGQLLAAYLTGPQGLASFVSGHAPYHDDHPSVEFTAPRALAEGVAVKRENLAALMGRRSLPPVANLAEEETEELVSMYRAQESYLQGHLFEDEGDYAGAAEAYHRALALDDRNADARYAFIQLNMRTLYRALAGSHVAMGKRLLADTVALDTGRLFGPQLRFLAGMLEAADGEVRQAERTFNEVLREDDTYLLALLNLAGL